MSEFDRVLKQWAAKFVPEGATVTRVTTEFKEGYHYSSWTHEDPSFEIWVYYVNPGSDVERFTYQGIESAPTLGELLTDLFAIAERSEA